MPAVYTLKWGSSRGKQLMKPDPSRFLFNVDTLWFTVSANNYDEVIERFREILDIGKQHAIETDNIEEYHEIQFHIPIFENPVYFFIQPNGLKPNWYYQIRNEDMAIYFARRDRNDGETFPIRVQINQFYLWTRGARQAFHDSKIILEHMGFNLLHFKPSRIDLCCHSDQYKWTVEDFKSNLYSYPVNVGRDNKPNYLKLDPDTLEFETMYVGDRRRLQQRIYNKSVEIIKKQKDYFFDIYEQHGMNPFQVWNIEFEIRRDYLKDFEHPVTKEHGCFDDLEYLLSPEGLSYLWTHVTRDKFNHASAFWKVLQKGDINKFTLLEIPTYRAKEINNDLMREIAQIRGRLQKLIIADEESLNDDLDDGYELYFALEKFRRLNKEYEEKKDRSFTEEVLKKRSKYMDYLINKLSKKKNLQNEGSAQE